MFYLYG